MKKLSLLLVGTVVSVLVGIFMQSTPVSAAFSDGKTCAVMNDPTIMNDVRTRPDTDEVTTLSIESCGFGKGETDLSGAGLFVVPANSRCVSLDAVDPMKTSIPCNSTTKDFAGLRLFAKPVVASAYTFVDGKNGGATPTLPAVLLAINQGVFNVSTPNQDTINWATTDCNGLALIDPIGKTKCEGIKACLAAIPGATNTTCVNKWDACMDGKTDATTANNCAKTIAAAPVTDADAETCNIAGVGWIVCPMATFIGTATDGAYTLVEQLLVFQIDDPFGDNALFRAWTNIRNAANVAFIIALFVVIFSQATSVGLSNYGIKKMLPRIIVAAILVNLSYYLCVFAVDVSNILGAGIDGIVKEAGKGVGSGLQDMNLSGWVASALAGGAIVAGGFALITSATGIATVLGGLALTFGIAALIAVLTALVVLIGRQAFLIILIILSPLAFVAYILPNTESLFDKWRKAFTTMLVFYPLVALLFSGSQLAAALMRSASGNALVDLFSIGVQAFPLFATPFILKFSGGLLGRVAGMVNNPNKGPFDKMRKAGEARLEARGNRVKKLGFEGERKNQWAAARAQRAAKRNAINESMARLSKEAEVEYIGGQLKPNQQGNPEDEKFARKMAGAGAVFNRSVSPDAMNRVMAQGAQTVDDIEAKNLKAAQVVLSNARMDGAGLKNLLQGNNAVGLNGQAVRASETMQMAAGAMMMAQGREMDTVVRTLATSGSETMRNFAVGQMQANYSKAKEKQVGLIDEGLMAQVASGQLGTVSQFNSALQAAAGRKAPELNADLLATQEKSSLERIKVELIDTIPPTGPLTQQQRKIVATAKQAMATPSVVARMTDDGRRILGDADATHSARI